MAIDLYEFFDDKEKNGTTERYYFIDDERYIRFSKFIDIYKRKTGMDFDPYEDLLIYKYQFQPLIESIKEAIKYTGDKKLKTEYRDFLGVILMLEKRNINICFFGD